MNKNDVVIKELLTKVEKQRAELGPRPKSSLVTNGVVRNPDMGAMSMSLSLNMMSKDQVIATFSKMLRDRDDIEYACDELGVKPESDSVYTIEQWKEDFVTRLSVIEWNEKKVKLDKTEAQLKALVSEEARTSDTLEEIAKLLG
jgi:hypothetical protein